MNLNEEAAQGSPTSKWQSWDEIPQSWGFLPCPSHPPAWSGQLARTEHLLGAWSLAQHQGKHEARSRWSMSFGIFQKRIPEWKVTRVNHLPPCPTNLS